MKIFHRFRLLCIFATVPLVLSAPIHAALIVNGSFETGFANWTRADQVGSEGTFFLQTGTTSPQNAFAVPAPPSGSTAAMTDAFGPGAHVMYQDFVVSGGMTSYSLAVSLYINNQSSVGFQTPATLDFATPALNQRARVDIMTTNSDIFGVTGPGVLQNLYETKPGDPLVSGYNSLQFDITALLQANQGATLRLRFSEVDNVAPFNFGVDAVDIRVGASGVPDVLPGAIEWLTVGALCVIGRWYRRRASGRLVGSLG